jgi:hypothetical protein
MLCMGLGALELGFQNRSGLVLLGPTSLAHQFQAKPCRCSRRVASIIERIDLGYARNPMRVLIILTAPLKDVIARTSVVSNAELHAGHVITQADIWARRPGSGATTGNEFDKVVGKRVFFDKTHNRQLN